MTQLRVRRRTVRNRASSPREEINVATVDANAVNEQGTRGEDVE
jgi:hypothetical protein